MAKKIKITESQLKKLVQANELLKEAEKESQKEEINEGKEILKETFKKFLK